MEFKRKARVRNAASARNSFVTRRAEMKMTALADIFRTSAGEHWAGTRKGTLKRQVAYSGFRYLDEIKLIYNWENRFLSVNYNLQLISDFSLDDNKDDSCYGGCHFTLQCKQKGLKGKREYSWISEGNSHVMDVISEALANPLIAQRLDRLDIMEMEITYMEEDRIWRVSCESLIGSASWILIPPVFSMVTPTLEEGVRFIELFELLGDALLNDTHKTGENNV